MFGYIRAYKPYMRCFEYDIYNAVYCGLCKDMGRRYGFMTRLTLSYDFTFLALLDMSEHQIKLDGKRERCIAHPFKKKLCACGEKCRLGYSSASAVILTCHKLRDDLSDKGIKGKIRALCLLPFFESPYKRACREYPQLAPKISKVMKLQRKIEREKSDKIDLACEPTAMMMKAVFSQLSDSPQRKYLLGRFGYLLGRFIYITDALDDVEEDFSKGNYNPLLACTHLQGGEEKLPQSKLEEIKEFALDSVNLTLGELAEVYVQLDIKLFRDIFDNIIYLGLKNVFSSVKDGNFRKALRLRKE